MCHDDRPINKLVQSGTDSYTGVITKNNQVSQEMCNTCSNKIPKNYQHMLVDQMPTATGSHVDNDNDSLINEPCILQSHDKCAAIVPNIKAD